MSKVNYGNDWDYTYSRIGGTLLMLKGEPCIIKSVNSDYISGTSKFSGNTIKVPPKEVDFTPPRIGYVNGLKAARYCFRMPSRHYKQGLDNKNFFGGLGFNYYDKPVIAALMNLYPKALTVADDIVNGEVKGKAFCRDFALYGKDNKLLLMFRERLCGTASWNKLSQGLNYTLDDDYNYLQEMLEESL